MTDADRPQLAKILAVFGSTFNEPVDDLKAEGYFAALRDLPLEDVRKAAYTALQTELFFPRPAKLREMITGNADEQADVAWGKLLREIRLEGYTGKPQLSDVTWKAVEELWGSWVHLCQTLPADGPELLGWAKRFRSVYGGLQRTARLPELPFHAHTPELTGGSK
jgi:hypothetical protein